MEVVRDKMIEDVTRNVIRVSKRHECQLGWERQFHSLGHLENWLTGKLGDEQGQSWAPTTDWKVPEPGRVPQWSAEVKRAVDFLQDMRLGVEVNLAFVGTERGGGSWMFVLTQPGLGDTRGAKLCHASEYKNCLATWCSGRIVPGGGQHENWEFDGTVSRLLEQMELLTNGTYNLRHLSGVSTRALQSDHEDGGSLRRTILGNGTYEKPCAFILIKHSVANWERRRNVNEETNAKIVLENRNNGWLIRYKGAKQEHVYASAVGMRMAALIFPVAAADIVLRNGVLFARACHAYADLVARGYPNSTIIKSGQN